MTRQAARSLSGPVLANPCGCGSRVTGHHWFDGNAGSGAGKPPAVDFRAALEPHGQWFSHSRWGEVWVPNVTADWQPYTNGRWVYTEEWGWYWVAEEEWGWIPYHYGRWVHDAQLGWAWVPGREWGPAWVRWRQSAKMPLGGHHCRRMRSHSIETVEADPRQWVFCPAHAVSAPRDRRGYRSSTRNAPPISVTPSSSIAPCWCPMRGHRIGVNPGISPPYIAKHLESAAA